MNEQECIRRLKNGLDDEAFEYIYYTYKGLVFFILHGYINEVDLTNDLMQDVFLKMYNKIRLFDGKNFKAWLGTIAKNTAIDYLKQNKLELIDEFIEISSDGFHEENKTYSYLFEEIRKELTKAEYDILVYTFVYNLKRREIAVLLDKPLGTILRTYDTAIKKLKKKYKEVS